MNEQTEKVTVIIPVYQAAATLARCVQSVLAQTYENLELLLIDDGCEDGSTEICDQLCTEDASGRIRVRHTENYGVSHARNLGLEMAEGSWVMFVDADDMLTPAFVSRLMDAAAKGSAKMVAQTQKISVAGKKDGIMVSGNYFLEHAVLNSDTHVWGKLYQKSFLDQLLFPETLSIGEDMLFLLKLAVKAGREPVICCIRGTDYLYTDNEQGAMNSAYKTSYLDQIFCWQQAETILEEHRGELSPYIFTRLATIQIMATLLVAGKVACAQELDRTDRLAALDLCSDEIGHALKTNGAFAGLPAGYKLKVMLYRMSRDRYLNLYGKWKK